MDVLDELRLIAGISRGCGAGHDAKYCPYCQAREALFLLRDQAAAALLRLKEDYGVAAYYPPTQRENQRID